MRNLLLLPDLVFSGLFALGLMAALALFLSLKREVRRQVRKDRKRMDELSTRLAHAEQPVERLDAPSTPRAAPVFQQSEPIFEAAPLRSGMNMSKRIQALRLLRRGEDVSHVAAALGVTRREVELLIRVQRLSAQRAASSAGAEAPS